MKKTLITSISLNILFIATLVIASIHFYQLKTESTNVKSGIKETITAEQTSANQIISLQTEKKRFEEKVASLEQEINLY
jgi:hypothetical protein